MRRLLTIAMLAMGLAMLSSSTTEAQTASYTCEFAGYAEVQDGELVELQITKLECD